MGAIIYCFNLNISPSMSYGMLQCDIAVTELHAYDFVIKKGHYLCWTLYIDWKTYPKKYNSWLPTGEVHGCLARPTTEWRKLI